MKSDQIAILLAVSHLQRTTRNIWSSSGISVTTSSEVCIEKAIVIIIIFSNRSCTQFDKQTNMDIDENTGQGTPPSQPANGDVEQFLLHQFSRMGTTDHDELVNQLQKVLGNQLNYTTARFFLDMNNWWVNLRQFFFLNYFSNKNRIFCIIMSKQKMSHCVCIMFSIRFIFFISKLSPYDILRLCCWCFHFIVFKTSIL